MVTERKVEQDKDLADGVFVMAVNDTFDEADYRETINKLIKLRSSERVGNNESLHAAILFEAFFNRAEERVCIFAKNLDNQVFGHKFVVKAAENALQNGIRINILIQDEMPDPGLFTEFIKENQGDENFEIKRVQKSKERTSSLNFSVMDNRSLRFEEDRERAKAWAIMYSPKLASLLLESFESMFKDANLVRLPVDTSAVAFNNTLADIAHSI